MSIAQCPGQGNTRPFACVILDGSESQQGAVAAPLSQPPYQQLQPLQLSHLAGVTRTATVIGMKLVQVTDVKRHASPKHALRLMRYALCRDSGNTKPNVSVILDGFENQRAVAVI